MKGPLILALVTWSLLTSSCTTISYESKGKLPIYLSAPPQVGFNWKNEGTCYFYLWGFYPDRCRVPLDELVAKDQMILVGNLRIEEGGRFKDWLISFFTLGFYWPRSYALSGRGVKYAETK